MKDMWFSVGRRWWAHEDVDATGMPWAFPFILDAIKDGNGRCSDLALTDARILRAAHLDGLIKANGFSIRDAYVAVGMLILDERGWGARNWDKWQRDQAKEKKKTDDKERIAEKRRVEKEVSQHVAATGGDVGRGRSESPRVAPHTDTYTSTTTEPHAAEAAVVAASAHTGVREDAAPPAATPTPTAPSPDHGDPDLQATIEAYRCGMASARGGGRAQFLPSGLLAQVLKLHADFGGPMVRQAIEEAIGAKNEIPGPSYVRAICQRMRDDPGERRPGPSMHQRRPGADPGVFRAKGPVACMMDGNPDEAFGPRLPEDQEDDSHAV